MFLNKKGHFQGLCQKLFVLSKFGFCFRNWQIKNDSILTKLFKNNYFSLIRLNALNHCHFYYLYHFTFKALVKCFSCHVSEKKNISLKTRFFLQLYCQIFVAELLSQPAFKFVQTQPLYAHFFIYTLLVINVNTLTTVLIKFDSHDIS